MEQATSSNNQQSGAVESVVIALQKVIGLLERIKNAIEESTGKIPRASVQLNTVTEATETATVEILNVLDTISNKVASVEQFFEPLRANVIDTESRLIADAAARSMAEVRSDIMSITMALQVQDITAQKIAAANHLIESVRVELMHELSYLEHTEQNQAPVLAPSNGREHTRKEAHAFDKNASYVKPIELQGQIDNVIKHWRDQVATVEA